MKNPLRITAALSLFVLVACASEKKDFEKMKPEIDPIIAEMTPLAADLAKARKDSAVMPTERATDPSAACWLRK